MYLGCMSFTAGSSEHPWVSAFMCVPLSLLEIFCTRTQCSILFCLPASSNLTFLYFCDFDTLETAYLLCVMFFTPCFCGYSLMLNWSSSSGVVQSLGKAVCSSLPSRRWHMILLVPLLEKTFSLIRELSSTSHLLMVVTLLLCKIWICWM